MRCSHSPALIEKALASLWILLYTGLLLVLFTPANLSRHLTGDEPHYLLIAHSLVLDGDLNLRNNYLEKHYASCLVFPLAYLFEPHATYTGVFFWFLKERWAIDPSSFLPTLGTKEFWFAEFRPTTSWPALFWAVLVGGIVYLLNRHFRHRERRA